ncbi:MAG: membrane protein [bacterium]|nr:MAG: membrane protein [bacterium]
MGDFIFPVFFLISFGLFYLGSDSSKVIASLTNIVLFILPLVSIVFGTMYFYNSREFMELMLAQPINRKSIFLGKFTGLTLSLSLGYALGVGIPFFIFGMNKYSEIETFLTLILSGVCLILIFVAIPFLISVIFEDKVKGLSTSILIWLYLSVVYDGLILFMIVTFSDYPLEQPVIYLSVLNPIDLARIMMLLKIDISALMVYTGAVFKKFFGSSMGLGISFFSLVLWIILPLLAGLKLFNKKDF